MTIDVGGLIGLHEELPALVEEPVAGSYRSSRVYSATPAGDLRKLTIDVPRHTISLDFTTYIPELDGAAPGERVRIPVKLTMHPTTTSPAVTFTTTAVVTMTRR